ncbi:MAG: hypothetical protein WC982_11740 [Advenella sp.]
MQTKNIKNQGLRNNPYINDNSQGLNNSTSQTKQNPYYNLDANQNLNQTAKQLANFDTANFLKGALIGAIGAYLLTNENAQKTIFKTFAKGSDMLGAGIEELKERMEDAKAELQAEQEAKA